MTTKELTLTALFAALTAVGAYLKVPLPYIPFTMQFFFCAMAGLLLGSRLGMLSQLTYVLIGLAGVPIFTEGGGPAYIFKPSFGYLIGFILCAYMIGKISENFKKISLIKLFLAVVTGMLTLFAVGAPYMYMIFNLYLHTAKTAWWAFYWGFLVYLGGDLLLCFLAAYLATKIIPRLKEARL